MAKAKNARVDVPISGYFFDKEKHLHYLDGKKLTGVTTVLNVIAKPQLIPWAVGEAVKFVKENAEKTKDMYGQLCYIVSEVLLEGASKAHTKKKDLAAEKGTDVHEEIEQWVKECISLPIGTYSAYMGNSSQVRDFILWATAQKVTFLQTEKNIYSRKMFIGGICDLVMEIGGKVYIGDIKTSKYIYPSYWWQTSAYQMCLQEMGMYPEIAGHIIIKVSDRTGFEVQHNFDFKGNSEAFRSCLFIYRQLASLEK